MYLESPAHAEDAVVRLLGRQALHGALHDLALLGDQIVGPLIHISPLFLTGTILISNGAPKSIPDLPYLRPSFLYAAASKYQLLSGLAQRMSHGRFMMYGASEGCDILDVMRVEAMGGGTLVVLLL